MAPTPTAEADQTETEPPLADRVKALLPSHCHFTGPRAAPPDSVPRSSSFEATWTTSSGSWTITYPGKWTPAAFRGIPQGAVPASTIDVSGPTGKWSFPGDTPTSRLHEFLVCVGALTPPEAPGPPPARKGSVYIGLLTEDGLVMGMDAAGSATLAFDGARPTVERDPEQDIERAREELDDAEMSALKTVHEAQDALAAIRRRAAELRRVPDILPAFQEPAVTATLPGGGSARMLHVSDAASITARLLAEADRETSRRHAATRLGRL